jgi:predicted ATPase/signal transduction histidine kinase/CheY-like chemotaxis protein
MTARGYLDVERLCEGRWTTLYRAVRASDGRHVLLEVLNPEHCDKDRATLLENQLELGKELKSAFVLQALGVSMFEGQPALELEDCGGLPLASLLGTPWAISAFLDLALLLTSALADLHERGIVHGALAPRYVLANRGTGSLKLFGLWHAQRATRDGVVQRPAMRIEDSLPYVSPEQTGRLNRRVDRRSDLYSLGVIFFELLTGQLPFEAKDTIGWVHCHVARKPPTPSEISPSIPSVLSSMVLKLLNKVPDERYQSAAGLVEDLRECLSTLGATGRIAAFQLGRADVCDAFTMPQQLYGRDRQRASLLEFFERAASDASPRLLVVSGAAGAGKSSLVHELQAPCAAAGWRFTVGKFEPLKRQVPYAAFVDAIRELVLDLLADSAERLAGYRSRISAAVGSSAGPIHGLLPELSLILGPPPPALELPPAETEKRLRGALRRFVAALATREHPVLIFLDDAQWIDEASIGLLVDLAGDTDLRHLLLIVACRENEFGPLHPLRQALDRLVGGGVAVDELELEPLSLNDLGQLVTDLTRAASAEALLLARIIQEKTQGNPFFVVQLLSELHRRALLVFDRALGRWRWDLVAIAEEPCSENVSDLLVGRLRELPAETQTTLGMAAHLGRSFERATLALVMSRDPGPALDEAVAHGLLLVGRKGHQFPHDRVSEAACSLIAEGERAATHLRIGRLLLGGTPPERLDERSFEIVNHLNLGASLLTSADERERVAELNLRAGRRAQAAAAHASARSYFAAGSALLGEESWERHYALSFALGIRQVECELAMGELAAAAARLAELDTRARGFIDRAAVVSARASLLTIRGEFTQALQELLELLRHIGIDLSLGPSDDSIKDEYERFRAELGERPIEELIELGVADASTQATMEILFKVVDFASSIDDRLLRLAVCRMANLSLTHGHCDASPLAFVYLGRAVGPYFGDYRSGFRFARFGLTLQEARQQSRFCERALTMAGVFVYPWTQPLEQAIELLRLGFAASVENGEPVFAWLALSSEVSFRLFMSDPLADVERIISRARRLARKAKLGGYFHDLLTVLERLFRALRGLTPSFPCFDETGFDEAEFEAHLASDPNLVIVEGWYWIRKLQARYHGGDYRGALAAAVRAEALLWTTGFAIERVTYHLYRALTLAASFDDATPEEREQRYASLVECSRELGARADDCPANFGACAALVAAELAHIDGNDGAAAQSYESAIRKARDQGQLVFLALGYEAAAAFYRARGFGLIADTYLREAHGAYQRWGAEGKSKQLEQRSPSLAFRGREGEGPILDLRPEQLDLLAVVKASQTISGVMLEDQVLKTLLQIVLEQGGARRARLVLTDESKEDGELNVTAEASVEDSFPLLQLAPRVPTSIVDYVRRTGKLVLLQDAAADAGRFAKDPYLELARPRSVLCLPVRRHGALAGILYLENDLAPGVFTPDRLLALELLATQAAVSLQNAELLARERAAREEAQCDRRRALLLGEVTALLSDSGDRPALSQAVRLLCTHGLADWAVLNLTQAGASTCVAHAHKDSLKEALLAQNAQRYASDFCVTPLASRTLGASAPLCQASLSDEQIRAYCADDEHAALSRKLGLRSLLVVPLVARGASLGLLLLMAATPHGFQPADVTLGAELGRRLAIAIESTRLAELEGLLHQAQKMEANGRLAGGVAHDFNNVLSVILTYSEFAREQLGPDSPIREELDEIKKAAGRATDLTRQLLAFSRHRPLESGVIDVNSVVREVKNMLATLVGSQVRLLFCPMETLGMTRADRGHVEQLLMNLAANARDAMPGGGTLLIETSNVTLDEAYARKHLEVRPGEYVLLTVSDTGCGMEDQVLARIFEPFFTTKKAGEGTGLGLATVFGIVQQSGGHVSVDSEVGRGTTFRIYWPRAAAADDPVLASAALAAVPAHGSETILLVEDDEQVRSAARAILQRCGYTVLEASGPGDALLISEQHAGPIDLLLSDIVMPRMSGPELAERIVAIRPGIRLLLMSGYTDVPIPRDALDSRVEFLQKPFTPQTIAEKVRRALDLHGNRAVSGGIV